MTRWQRFRWWLAAKIAPRWQLEVFVEFGNQDPKGPLYKLAVFTEIPPLLEGGSRRLYYVTDKLSYLTIKQRTDPVFREAVMIADLMRRRQTQQR